MRVLTATSTTQGDRPDDCCWTHEGELVSLPLLECSCPDCGCDRSFTGLDSHRATTTCAVTEAPLDPAALRRAVVRSLAAGGWLVDLDAPPGDGPDVVEALADLHLLVDGPRPDAALSALDRELVDDVIARIVDVAESFPPGTVLGRHPGHGILVRRSAAAEELSGGRGVSG
ncbi:MAG TPA: hypothetical protein VK507_25350 [Iamia sp.]|nr:hypothetical protein [Iamia sp.]